jgi:DNA polymerase elongation subunit (family B)
LSRFYTNCQVLGNNILVKEFNNGKRKRYKVEYKPTLYVPGDNLSTWYNLHGEPVKPLQFDCIKEAREFVKTNADVDNFTLYGNTQFQYAFIADEYPDHDLQFDLKEISIWALDIECESESGFSQNAAELAKDRINVITLKNINKIESHVFTFVDGDIYNKKNKYTPGKNIKHYEFESEEDMLLGFLDFWNKIDPDIIIGWNIKFYDIPYIYNRLLLLFGEKVARRLSPWNNVQSVVVNFMNSDHNCYELMGISTLDYLQLYKKYILDPRENYKLDFIAKTELKGIGKIDWHEKYDSMKDFYQKDFQGFVEYNIQDVLLIELLEKKRKLIELVVSVAYLAKVNYVDVLAQTRTWDMLIYNWLKQEKIVIPQKEHQVKSEQFIGAYVKDPKPGMYYNIVSFDVASLYPNIIRVLNIGIETKVPELKMELDFKSVLDKNDIWKKAISTAITKNCTIASNGVFYKKDKLSFYSRMVETFFNNRKQYQAELKKAKNERESCTNPERQKELDNLISKLDIKQKATKIFLNSLYGAFGSSFFRFYDLDNAEAVTTTGQVIIQYIQKGLNEYLNKLFKTYDEDFVIASDTDSVMIVLDKIVKHVFKDKNPNITKIVKFLDKVCKDKLEPEIDRLFEDITKNIINGMQAEKSILSMKREVIADRGIWSSKKHYIMQVWNSEGENYFECNDCKNKFSGFSDNPPPCNDCNSTNTKQVSKLKIMGFEMVKSSLPQFTKDAMKKSVNIVMNGTQGELAEFIESTRKDFMNLSAEDVAFPRSANNLEKWSNNEDTYTKGTPIAVKAVLLHNEYLKKLKLQYKYAPIGGSEKIKFVYLKQPNPIHDKVIAFNGILPKEFGLHKYIDYTEMFEIALIKPLQKILEPINWSTEKQYDMEKFFN